VVGENCDALGREGSVCDWPSRAVTPELSSLCYKCGLVSLQTPQKCHQGVLRVNVHTTDITNDVWTDAQPGILRNLVARRTDENLNLSF
jgi:hypothetical protein